MESNFIPPILPLLINGPDHLGFNGLSPSASLWRQAGSGAPWTPNPLYMPRKPHPPAPLHPSLASLTHSTPLAPGWEFPFPCRPGPYGYSEAKPWPEPNKNNIFVPTESYHNVNTPPPINSPYIPRTPFENAIAELQDPPSRRPHLYGDGSSRPVRPPQRIPARPTDWRVAFKGENASKLPRCLQNFLKSISKSRHDYDIHPILLYKSNRTPPTIFQLDLEKSLFDRTAGSHILTDVDLTQLATSYPIDNITITHPLLPWSIPIHATSPSGITVLDVLTQLHDMLMKIIQTKEFMTDVLSAKERADINAAYLRRCAGDARLLKKGIRRIDYLRNNIILQGMKKMSSKEWRMELLFDSAARRPRRNRHTRFAL